MKCYLALLALACMVAGSGCQGIAPGTAYGPGQGFQITRSRMAPRIAAERQGFQPVGYVGDAGCEELVADGTCGVCGSCCGQGPEWCGLCNRYCGCSDCACCAAGGACDGSCDLVCSATGAVLDCPCGDPRDSDYAFTPGPPVAQVAYPYYTVRGPRDFLLSNPPPLGPY
jgi:hypothetical protein